MQPWIDNRKPWDGNGVVVSGGGGGGGGDSGGWSLEMR